MRIETGVEGIGELMAVIKGLRPSVQRRILRPALIIEGRRLSQIAKSLAPVRYGTLRKSIGAKIKTYPSGAVVAVIGHRHGFKKFIGMKTWDPAVMAHMVHGGTKPHFLSGRTAVGGRVYAYTNKRGIDRYIRTRSTYTTKLHPGAKANPYLLKATKISLAGAGGRMSERMAREITKLAKGNKLKL